MSFAPVDCESSSADLVNPEFETTIDKSEL